VVTFIPLVGALLLLLFPRRHRDIRVFALVVSIADFIISLHLPKHLERGVSGFQFELNVPWIPTPNIHYHMGIDGISVWLVVLTTFLTPLCVLISWNSIHERVKEFFILLLVLETAMIGVFVSLDLFLFYFFWEATLIPMALLIGVYGHGRRVYAAVKFFLYTMIASVFMLAAILWLYAKTGTFDFVQIQTAIHNGQVEGFAGAAFWLFLGFFVAFAVKVPLFPVHTWLPDAHVEAPTAGSVLLAGVMLKMGTYGMLRFNLGLFPEQARANASWIIVLALIGIIYGALVAMVQPNMKKLIAYSSISHLGFVVLGIFSFTSAGLNGATYVMLAHGVSTGALFMLAGILYERRHTYEISEYGGLASPMPVYATFFLFIILASVGLPLLNGFVGEFLVLSGAFQARAVYGVLGATGVIWSAGYLLWMYQRVFYGKVKHQVNLSLPDLSVRERVALWPAAIAALVMGVAPLLWLNAIDPAVQAALAPFAQMASKVAGQ
jgi:NADH-quinone oxidoreductase subunit M